MEAKHEEAHVLHQEGDETEKDAGADCDQGIGPHWQNVLLQANQVDHKRPEDESGEKHGSFETAVAKEGAKDAKKQVEHANGGGDDVVLSITVIKIINPDKDNVKMTSLT